MSSNSNTLTSGNSSSGGSNSSSGSTNNNSSSSSGGTVVQASRSKYRVSLSYLGLSAGVVLFTLMMMNVIGMDFVSHTVSSQIILSIALFTLHLLFGIYVYPSAFHVSGGNTMSLELKIQRAFTGWLIGMVLFYFVSILYGAPITRSFFRTLFFGQLLSSMTAVPTAILLGCHPQTWKDLFFSPNHNSVYETCCTIVVVFSLVGAWVGGFVIPLDWDRPWQAWPISCAYGSIGGHILGLWLSSIYSLFHKEKKLM